MKALKTKICSYAIALLVSAGFSTPTYAGSSDFAGIFVAGHAEMNVVAISGTFTDSDGNRSEGVAGGYAPTAGWEAGFNFPLGPNFFITAGYAYGGGDSGKIATARPNGADATNAADVSLHADSPEWYYIAPSISIFDNSAIYVKIGQADANLKAIGSVTGTPNNISGDMWGIGTTTIADNGLFIKTEAGAIQYEQFKITGIGGTTTSTVEGDPLVGYGHVSIGYKF